MACRQYYFFRYCFYKPNTITILMKNILSIIVLYFWCSIGYSHSIQDLKKSPLIWFETLKQDQKEAKRLHDLRWLLCGPKLDEFFRLASPWPGLTFLEIFFGEKLKSISRLLTNHVQSQGYLKTFANLKQFGWYPSWRFLKMVLSEGEVQMKTRIRWFVLELGLWHYFLPSGEISWRWDLGLKIWRVSPILSLCR